MKIALIARLSVTLHREDLNINNFSYSLYAKTVEKTQYILASY